jgi:hypothetical protein
VARAERSVRAFSRAGWINYHAEIKLPNRAGLPGIERTGGQEGDLMMGVRGKLFAGLLVALFAAASPCA